MRIEIAYITPRRQRLKSAAAQRLVDEYVQRSARYTPIQSTAYESEPALLAAVAKGTGRAAGILFLLDSRGQALTSEAIAGQLGKLRDRGAQGITLAIGPADGWSPTAWERADLRLSLGAITLPHELALVVLAEQVYRALSILAGHPYHGGHAEPTQFRQPK